MSGAQIGSAVGFVAGFFLPGGPMVWSAIGGAIGGWISPTQVNGPRIGDGQSQSSAEGMPIPWILGTGPSPIQGQIVQKSPRREVKKTDDGKGSGVETNTYEAHQDFCILFCESSEHRGSLMKGVLFCLVDGKIVYDMRPEANFGAENEKFLEHHTFYDGNEAQMPDPTMEALVGVDYAMYYRGVFTLVGRDINLSVYGDRIPVYQVVMVGEGETVTEVVTDLVPPYYGRFVNQSYPVADPPQFYNYQCAWTDHTADAIQSPIFETEAEAREWFETETGLVAPNIYIGYSANSQGTGGAYTTGETSGIQVTVSQAASQADVTDLFALTLMYQWFTPVGYVDVEPASSCPFSVEDDWTGTFNGSIIKKVTGVPSDLLIFDNCGGGQFSAGYYPFCMRVISRAAPPVDTPMGDPCLLGVPTLLPDTPGFRQDCAGVITPVPAYEAVSGSYYALQEEAFTTIGISTYFTKRTLAPIILQTDPIGTEEFWTEHYDAAVIAETMEPDLVYGVDYPIEVEDAYSSTVSTTTLVTQDLGLDTAITRISLRSGLTVDDIDVADMDQQLMGYGILQPYTGTEALSTLLQAFLSFGSEYDAQLHFHKHGEDVEIVIDPQDFIEGSDETDENTRDQQIEYPRVLSVIAIDAEQNYTARPQVARRTSPDIRAIGDEAIEVAVVLPPDYHAQLADIGLKVMWARAQGPREFSVPFAQADTYLKLVPGMPFALDSKRWIVDTMRIGDGEIHIKAAYDRQSAYTSDVQATPALPPTPPPSNIGGVTLGAFMNLPRLRSKDNSPGMYVAVAGLLAGWPGCFLQISVDDEVTWTIGIASMTQPSVLGYLTAPITDSSGDTLSVTVHGGELNSITSQQILDGGNPCAVITAGTAEILQFEDANETTEDEYDLTNLVRGGLATLPVAHSISDRFVKLTEVYFLPLDISLAGKTIKFRPVTFGTAPESNAVYSEVFNPLFTGPQISSPLTVGGENVTTGGLPIYVVT